MNERAMQPCTVEINNIYRRICKHWTEYNDLLLKTKPKNAFVVDSFYRHYPLSYHQERTDGQTRAL